MRWRELLYLQKNDRMALLGVLATIILAMFIIFFGGSYFNHTDKLTKDSTRQQALASSAVRGGYIYADGRERKITLVPFDPNTADSTTLLGLGLAPWQVKAIYHYRAKGGVYRRPEDFSHLYGLTVKQYRMLQPYIRISSDYAPASTLYPSTAYNQGRYPSRSYEEKNTALVGAPHSTKLHEGQRLSLNDADTAALMRVPGIGIGYAHAIINYRNRLGGFYSPQQILDIGGVPETAVPYLFVNAGEVKKIKINHLTVNQLRRHPYINFYQARTIFDYRRLHGPLHDIRVLAHDPDFPPEELRRLAPYLDYE